MEWKRIVRVVIAVVVIEIIVIVAGFFIIMYSGMYDVAATSKDPAIMDWALGTISDRSVEHHAGGIPVSPIYESPDLAVGYEHYSEMCVECHGAPGVDRGEAGKGLNPEPPLLHESTKDMSPSEVFWVVKYGIKMTGMPAWGVTHDDSKLWQITAFVKHTNDMTAEQYAAMGKAAAAGKPPAPAMEVGGMQEGEKKPGQEHPPSSR